MKHGDPAISDEMHIMAAPSFILFHCGRISPAVICVHIFCSHHRHEHPFLRAFRQVARKSAMLTLWYLSTSNDVSALTGPVGQAADLNTFSCNATLSPVMHGK